MIPKPIEQLWSKLGPAAPFVLIGLFCVLLGAVLLKVDPLFILVGLAAMLVGAFILSKPFYGVILYLALLYVRPGDLYPQLEPLRLTLLGVALLTGAFLLQVLVYREVNTIITPPMIFMGLVVLAIVLSLPGSYYKTISMTRFTDTLRLVFMTFLIVHLVDTSHRIRGFMTALSLILIGLSTALVLRFFLNPDSRVDNGGSGGMIGGFLGDGNDFALAQNVILPWTIMMIGVTKSKILKIILIYGIAVGAVAVGCTFSRGGFLGLVTVFGAVYVYWVARSRKYAIGLFMAAIAVIIGLFAFVAFVPDEFLERITSIKDYEQDESARGRLDAWGAGGRMIKDRTFFGVGAGAFAIAYGMKYKPADAIANNWREAHSVYVQITCELGLMGLFCYLGMLGTVAWAVFKRRHTVLADPEDDRVFHAARGAVYGSLATWLITSAFLSVAYYPHIFLLVMITAGLERMARYRSLQLPMVEEVEEE